MEDDGHRRIQARIRLAYLSAPVGQIPLNVSHKEKIAAWHGVVTARQRRSKVATTAAANMPLAARPVEAAGVCRPPSGETSCRLRLVDAAAAVPDIIRIAGFVGIFPLPHAKEASLTDDIHPNRSLA